MANGQRAAPAVPLSPCLIHEKGVQEGVADRRDAPGRTSRQKHTLPTAAQPLTASEDSTWPVQEKKKVVVFSLVFICDLLWKEK